MSKYIKKTRTEPLGFGLVSFFLLLLGASPLISDKYLTAFPTNFAQKPVLYSALILMGLVVLSGSYLGFPLSVSAVFLLGVGARSSACLIWDQIHTNGGLPWLWVIRFWVLLPLSFVLLVRTSELSYGVCTSSARGCGFGSKPKLDDFLLLTTAIIALLILFP